jgi:hypothetical protein
MTNLLKHTGTPKTGQDQKSVVMALELVLGRNATVMVDGQRPGGRWCYGTCEGDGDTLVSDDLTVGEHRIRSIQVIGKEHESGGLENPRSPAYRVFNKYLVPRRAVVVTDDGRFSGPITVVVANPDEDTVTVRLHNGEDLNIDEITLYMKAELTAQ